MYIELDKFKREGTDLVKESLRSIDKAEQDEQRRIDEANSQNEQGSDSHDSAPGQGGGNSASSYMTEL